MLGSLLQPNYKRNKTKRTSLAAGPSMLAWRGRRDRNSRPPARPWP